MTRVVLLALLFFCAQLPAQDFFGYVRDCDSLNSPLYQANITVTSGGKVLGTYKSYFDGSFHFTPQKKQSYEIRIAYAGYLDTVVTVVADKKGVPSPARMNVVMRKDGLRLTGTLLDKETRLPIKDVVIVLRNVMTRQEEKFITGKDGLYNLRMDYETNYRFVIDKRSEGVINKYQDTAFYISTVGFTLPLNFKLNIELEKARTQTPERGNYDPTAKPKNTDVKPVVVVKGRADSLAQVRRDSIALAQAKTNSNSPTLKKEEAPKKLTDADKKRLAMEAEMARKREAEVAAAKKLVDDIERMKQESARRKFVDDSLRADAEKQKQKGMELLRALAEQERADSIAAASIKKKGKKKPEEQNVTRIRDTAVNKDTLVALKQDGPKPEVKTVSEVQKKDTVLVTKNEVKVPMAPAPFKLQGSVKDDVKKLPLENVKVKVKNMFDVQLSEITTDKDGKFQLTLSTNRNYVVLYEHPNFKIASDTIYPFATDDDGNIKTSVLLRAK